MHGENLKLHILYPIAFFRKSCRLRDNMEKFGKAGQTTDNLIVGRTRFPCRTTKTTDSHTYTHTHTHTEYVILIVFLRQQCLHESSSILRYTFFAGLVNLYGCQNCPVTLKRKII